MVSSTGLNHLISFYKKVQVHFGQNNLENYDVQTQLHIMKIRLKLEHQLGNFYKMGLKEHDFFIKPIQEKINKLPKYEDDNSSY